MYLRLLASFSLFICLMGCQEKEEEPLDLRDVVLLDDDGEEEWGGIELDQQLITEGTSDNHEIFIQEEKK